MCYCCRKLDFQWNLRVCGMPCSPDWLRQISQRVRANQGARPPTDSHTVSQNLENFTKFRLSRTGPLTFCHVICLSQSDVVLPRTPKAYHTASHLGQCGRPWESVGGCVHITDHVTLWWGRVRESPNSDSHALSHGLSQIGLSDRSHLAKLIDRR